MSGPKVVRIVTREEILALCEGYLARLDITVEEWIKIGRRNDMVTEAEISATKDRQESLRRLLSQDRFVELQKAIPAEIDFLRADQEARLSRAATKKAEARNAQRQTEAVASSVLAALEQRGLSVPVDLRSSLKDAAAGRSEGTVAISRAFALLSEEKGAIVSNHQRTLADSLKGTDDRQSFKEWLASQPIDSADEPLTRLDRRISELAVLLGEEETGEFDNRLRRLILDEPSPHRSLMIDSLEVDIAQTVEKAKNRSALQLRLRMLAAELSTLESEISDRVSRNIGAQIDDPSDVLEALEVEAIALLSRIREQAAPQFRRQAVLKGLTDLGYQVTEGMETAWIRDGKVVIKRPSHPDYGVELGGRGDSGRVQMRTVAIRNAGSPVDAARDRDAETIFCSDVTKLQEQFAKAGGGIVIERALPIGATPLRTVGKDSDASDDDIQENNQNSRQRTI